ncbi:hypothetical protein E2562_002351 [Oryza meyeriana var. granulata]|uniref:Uncharacterized protein n=1 Tax=Oryza meyeriana var. granulata TaxID=110450 RepID=A0A6G1BIR9_9ORYZ|nr:hypothetical protein E2562_002351 [Oryza meyeriana var. granulata]
MGRLLSQALPVNRAGGSLDSSARSTTGSPELRRAVGRDLHRHRHLPLPRLLAGSLSMTTPTPAIVPLGGPATAVRRAAASRTSPPPLAPHHAVWISARGEP